MSQWGYASRIEASTGGREDFCLEIQPSTVSVPPDSLDFSSQVNALSFSPNPAYLNVMV